MDKLYVSQKEIDQAIDNLLYQIRQSEQHYKYVVGIRNGGVNVSEPIAKALGLPHKSVGISCYGDSKVLHEPIISDDFQWEPDGLLVDDLIDSGRSVIAFKAHFGEADVAVVFWKEGTIIPDYYVYKKPHHWVVFPWEVE
ncbi:MAG: phosphoribosyltransferase domain-containing protein [Proteobacteria bacterium]|jgi:hypoxanthine phosphoribosyltransferase|nr:phosphoribosyltransferase domain-containing protein [Pseudomonadota bacterium]